MYENQWLRVHEHRFMSGQMQKIYAIVERAHSVIIIPLSPSGQTLLLQQYRYPTGQHSWEFPMGGIDQGETPEAAARRELLEETQLAVIELEQIGHYHAVPGLTPQKVSVFVVRVSDQELAEAFVPVGADDIRTSCVVPVTDLYQMIGAGSVTDGFTLVGALYLRQLLDREAK
ncbi:MAG: NUDIX hydrolase [Chloroflexota bacterium]|nr:NUDIX hydrolase [Chloroflexota bacterium]